MEKINRHNYEAWFLDYLEGNLSAEERHDLLLFLEQNPDLKEELDIDFSDVTLNPQSAVFENKPVLKVADESVLSLNTVEYWMIESVEGNLTASKQKELDDFVRKHQLEKSYQAFRSAVLQPDLNEVFAEKRKLKIATGLVIPMYLRIASVAAVVILLVSVGINRFSENQQGLTGTPVKADFTSAARVNYMVPIHQLANSSPLENGADSGVSENHSYVHRPHNQNQNNQQPEELVFSGEVKNPEKDTLIRPSENPGNDISNNEKNPLPDNQEDVAVNTTPDVQSPGYITEEPYRFVTNAASNFVNREISFSRDKDLSTNEYVAYEFKLGNFEFERKKSR